MFDKIKKSDETLWGRGEMDYRINTKNSWLSTLKCGAERVEEEREKKSIFSEEFYWNLSHFGLLKLLNSKERKSRAK